jgi:hypothetical protein
MRPATIVYFLGILIFGIGITVGTREPAAFPIILGMGLIIASLFKYCETLLS